MTARKTARPRAYVRQKPRIARACWLALAGFLFAAVAGFTVGWEFIRLTLFSP